MIIHPRTPLVVKTYRELYRQKPERDSPARPQGERRKRGREARMPRPADLPFYRCMTDFETGRSVKEGA
jgi:hypothetical protein